MPIIPTYKRLNSRVLDQPRVTLVGGMVKRVNMNNEIEEMDNGQLIESWDYNVNIKRW